MARQEKVKKLSNYPYMIAIAGVIVASVIAQILIVVDLFFPLLRMDADAVSSVMSTCSEVIAGMYGITLTGYIFFADRFQGMSKDDESLYAMETLRNYSRISFQLWRKLEKLRQYYNLTLHDPNMTVTREMCDLAREVRQALDEKNTNP